jgi:hypothetical protein
MRIYYLILGTIIAACSTKTDKIVQSAGFRQVETRTDSSFTKFKVDNIVTCYTTLTDLKTLDIQFRKTDTDELDSLFITCSHHSDNYFTNHEKGLIFGTYAYTELVNTFWLTDKFKGTLAGKFIDVQNYSVSQMTRDFPEPRFRWSTTGVSPYWIYTNDTINFFITLDKAIPRFPLNEKHYANHKVTGIQLELSCWKIYGPDYAVGDTVLIKPLYAPLTDTHTNYFLLQKQPGISTTLKEVFSFGKKTTMVEKRIGLWIEYTPDHKLLTNQWYENGDLIKRD